MRYLFTAELVFNPDGTLAQNQPFTLWSDNTGGTQYTDVVAPDGVSPVTLITTADGLTPEFRGPDEVKDAYVESSVEFRQHIYSADALHAKLAEVFVDVTAALDARYYSRQQVDAIAANVATGSLTGQGGITTVRALTQAQYTALTVKDPYTLYVVKQLDGTVVMQYLGGAVDPTPPSGTPTAPGGTIGTVTQTSIQLASITAPSSDGGSPITGYRLFAYNPAGTSAATFNPEWLSSVYLPANLPTSFTFTNMVAGVTYQVGVFALNANGEGTRRRLSATTDAVPSGGGGGVAGGGGLPAAVASLWYFSWQRPRLREMPSDVRNIINHVVIAMATSSSSGTGNITWGPTNGETAAEVRADILALRAEGKNVCIGIGGSDGGGITITNPTQVTQAFNSIASMVTAYGVNGIDIDLEPGSSSWTQASMVSLCSQLKTAYGSSFIIGISAALYSPYTATWLSLTTALGANYDYLAVMLYDFPEAADSRLTGVTIDKGNTMAAGGVPNSKMIFGFMCKPPEGYANASTPQLTLDAWRAVKAARTGVRGGFIWESWIEGRTSWQWTRLTGRDIRGL